MNYAKLMVGLGKDRGKCVREAGKVIVAGYQYIFYATISYFIEYRRPKRRTFRFGYPDAKYVFFTVSINA
jgi:hypothetical protein